MSATFVAVFACQGALSVKFGSAMEVEIDGEVQTFANGAVWTPPAKEPCIYRMRPVLAAGERTFSIKGDDATGSDGGTYRFPQYGEGNWVRVALGGDSQVTLTGYKVSNIYYADAEHGDDDWDGTTDYAHRDESAVPKKGPKKTLQAAHNGAASGSSTAGFPIVLVAPGVYDEGVTNMYSSGTSNLCKRRLYATKSIGFIATEGPERTFIVGAPDPSTGGTGENAVGGVHLKAEGHQFIQGFTITGCYSPATQNAANQYGAAFYGGVRAYALDCVISNNVANKYSVAFQGKILRSWILENTAYQYLSQYSAFVSCVFAGNRITIGNNAQVQHAIGHYGSMRFCTVDLANDRNTSGRNQLQNETHLYGVLAYKLTNSSTIDAAYWHGGSSAIGEPLFADPTSCDYRLGMKSPAMDVVDYATLEATVQKYLTADVDGRMPVLHDGKMPIGAVWRNEPEDRYVDCVNGDDANDGSSAAQAKRTIRAAMAEAVGGDTVRVLPGVYGSQEGSQTATGSIGARVVVRDGVTLESTEGADKTFIVGAAATGEQVDSATYGTGTNAVRCVYAKGTAVVRGFTLTGGRAVGTANVSGNGLGAAFYSASTREATVEDCIISNNAAWYGAVYRAIVRNCRIFANVGVSDSASGAACFESAMYGSIIDRNRGSGTVYYPMVLENCTLGRNNYSLNGSGNPQLLYWYTSNDKTMVNCAILGNGRLYFGGGGKLVCTNCVIVESNNTWQPAIKTDVSCNVIFTNSTGVAVDPATYSPVLGSFAGIDRGNAEVSSEALGDTDIYGTPRILNGALDIGAVEYDWRPTFAAELGRRFTMTYASPSVTTNATGGLLVPDGAVAGAANSGGPYAIAFSLTGGSLAVYVGGELAGESSGTGEQSIQFRVANAADEIKFVYTTDAQSVAVLKRFSGAGGFTVSFR